MRIFNLKANQTELSLNNNTTIFFSYNTPVAACVGGLYYKTNRKWSVTTSKHIGQWLGGIKAELKDQSFFDELVK